MSMLRLILFFICLPLVFCHAAENELFLKDNLKFAKPGDYLVTMQNKNYSLLLVRSVEAGQISVEEITVPAVRLPSKPGFSWKRWIQEGAPKNSSWLLYKIKLPEGTMQQAYSYTRNEWVVVPQTQNFLSTLLNLKMQRIPQEERKRVGLKHSNDRPDDRPLWEPKLVFEGKTVPGVAFCAWRARWPKDGSGLSGKVIEAYLPKEEGSYPAYFPYWMEVIGMVGKAKVRIVDAGSLL
jgi:hypothetical protein